MLYTFGKTLWTVDHTVARPLSTHAYIYIHTHTHTHTHTDINSWSGIRTHDPYVWAGEDSSCLTPRSHWGRQIAFYINIKPTGNIYGFYMERCCDRCVMRGRRTYFMQILKYKICIKYVLLLPLVTYLPQHRSIYFMQILKYKTSWQNQNSCLISNRL
jgi:hypothetical protein